jgi:hypothetical protein
MSRSQQVLGYAATHVATCPGENDDVVYVSVRGLHVVSFLLFCPCGNPVAHQSQLIDNDSAS